MKEALKLALDALMENEHYVAENERHAYVVVYNEIIEKCKEALAQPAQEPVSVTYKEVADAMNSLWNGTLEQHQIAEQMANKKLYTTPPAAMYGITKGQQ